MCYAKRYADLFDEYCSKEEDNCDFDGLRSHWEEFGEKQGLRYGCVRIPDHIRKHLPCYAARYGNLAASYCNKGLGEGCDWEHM